MKLLLLEDEPDLAQSVLDYLHTQGVLCEWAASFDEAEDRLAQFSYDCILLDLTLPDGDGLNLLRQLRTTGRTEGAIILSARGGLEDRLQGLELGADDYLPKPFHLAELLARVHSVVRRRHFEGRVVVRYGAAEIEPGSREVRVGTVQADLSRKEFDLLLFLLSNRGRVVTREGVAEHLSGDDAAVFDNFDFVYAQVKNLKKKMAEAGAPLNLRAVYGLGYKLEEPDETA